MLSLSGDGKFLVDWSVFGLFLRICLVGLAEV